MLQNRGCKSTSRFTFDYSCSNEVVRKGPGVPCRPGFVRIDYVTSEGHCESR